MFLDINTHIRFEGNDRNAQVFFSLLEAFAGPAQSPRVDVPPSAAVSGSLAGVKRRVDKVPSVLAHCKRNGSRVTNRNHRQLTQNRLHRDNVKHLLVSLALIHNTGSAIQKPICNRKLLDEISCI